MVDSVGVSNDVSDRLKKLEDQFMTHLPRVAAVEIKLDDKLRSVHRWIQRIEYRVHRLAFPDGKPMFTDAPKDPQIVEGAAAAPTAAPTGPALPPPCPANVGHRGPGAVAASLVKQRPPPTSVTIAAAAPEQFTIHSPMLASEDALHYGSGAKDDEIPDIFNKVYALDTWSQ